MADLVGDVPPGRGRRGAPPGPVEAGHQVLGDGGLGGQVTGERGHVCRHPVTSLPSPAAAYLVPASATGRTWPTLTCSPPWLPPRAGALPVWSIFIASQAIGKFPSGQHDHAHLRLLARFLQTRRPPVQPG